MKKWAVLIITDEKKINKKIINKHLYLISMAYDLVKLSGNDVLMIIWTYLIFPNEKVYRNKCDLVNKCTTNKYNSYFK